MTLSIKNGEYKISIRLDLMLFMSLWKEFQLLQILNDLSTKHVIKLILYENDMKLLKFKKSSVLVDLWYEVWDFDYWYLEWIHRKSDGVFNLFFYRKFNVRVPLN